MKQLSQHDGYARSRTSVRERHAPATIDRSSGRHRQTDLRLVDLPGPDGSWSFGLASINRVIGALLRAAATACGLYGLAAAVLGVLSAVSATTGGPALQPLLAATQEDTLPLALALVASASFTISALATIVLVIAWSVLRHVLLCDTCAATGVVASSCETWLSIDRRPVMVVRVLVETPMGLMATSARQLFVPGSEPLRSDRVEVALSRHDPACCRIVGRA